MRHWLAGLSLALLTGLPQPASAQIVIHPPHVRIRPFWLRPRVVIMPPAVTVGAPPPVYVAPVPSAPPQVYVQPCQPCTPPAPPAPPAALPPPPVHVPQPPPVYTAPVYAPPVYVAPPVRPALPPAPRLPPPRLVEQWRHRVGLGARFAGVLNTDHIERSSQLGFGGELLFRVARRVTLEMAGEYQRTVDEGFARFDVPVTFGMRVHIGAPDWVLSPYFVFATGVDYASLDLLRARDVAWFAEGQAGGGLEIRLGHRVGLTADVRGVGRLRLTEPEEAVAATLSINGKPFHPMQNHVGVQFRLGGAVYF